MIKKLKNKLRKDDNLKELLSGSAVTFVIKIIGMLLGYVVVLLISRKYGAEGVGLYELTSRLLNSLAVFGALGINLSVLRYVGQFAKKSNSPARLKQLLKYSAQLTFPFAVLVGVGLYFFAETISIKLFDNPTYIPALKIGAFALPFFTLNLINIEFIRGLKLLKISEYLRSINRQAAIIVLLVLSVFGYGILNAVYALVAGLLLTFVFSLGYVLRFFQKNQRKPLREKNLTKKELLKTSFPMMTTTVASFVLANSAVLFLEIYSSTAEVGIFNIALRLAQLVSLVLLVVNTISAPKIAELYWNDKIEELKKFLHHSSKIIFFASLVIALTIGVFSSFFLGLFGEEFLVGNFVLIVLILGQMINAATGPVAIFFNMTGNQAVFKNIIVATMLLVLIGYFVFIPMYGMQAAAWVSVFGAFFLNITGTAYVYKKLDFVTFYNPFQK